MEVMVAAILKIHIFGKFKTKILNGYLNIYGKYYDQKRHQNKSSGHKNENNNNENHLK